MEYTILVEYSNNLKLGKLSVLNKDKKAILNKIKVSIPKKLITATTNIKLLQLTEREDLVRFDDNKNYQTTLQEFKKNKQDSFFVNTSNENQLLLAPQSVAENDAVLRIDNDVFVVSQKDFESIKEVLMGDKISLQLNKVAILWFSQTAIIPASNITGRYKQLLSSINDLEDNALFSNEVFEIENKRKSVKEKNIKSFAGNSKFSIGINKKTGPSA